MFLNRMFLNVYRLLYSTVIKARDVAETYPNVWDFGHAFDLPKCYIQCLLLQALKFEGALTWRSLIGARTSARNTSTRDNVSHAFARGRIT